MAGPRRGRSEWPNPLVQASALLKAGQLLAAESLLREQVAVTEAPAEAQRLLAVVLLQQGRGAEAEQWLREALRQAPTSAALLTNLGSARRAQGDLAGAIELFRQAVTQAPKLAAAWFNLAKALKADAQLTEAEAAFSQAVQLGHTAARIGWADSLKALGRIELAAAQYRAALAHDPAAGYAWWGLANLKTVSFSAAELRQLRNAAWRPQLPRAQRIPLLFALASALDGAADYTGATAALREGNGLRRQEVKWERGAFSAQVTALIDALAEPVAEVDGLGAEVIFIVGLPRSGSTLVEQILASHPTVCGASELPDLPAVIAAAERQEGRPLAQWAATTSPARWRELGTEYLLRTRRWRAERERFTDKLPANILYVGAIARMLPGARVVICERDPYDTALSCYKQLFAHGNAFSYDLADIAAYQHDCRRLAAHWQQCLGERVLRVGYEQLVVSFEEGVRALLAHCRLPFAASCLAPHQTERVIRTASAGQVRQPVSQRGRGVAAPYRAGLFKDFPVDAF